MIIVWIVDYVSSQAVFILLCIPHLPSSINSLSHKSPSMKLKIFQSVYPGLSLSPFFIIIFFSFFSPNILFRPIHH